MRIHNIGYFAAVLVGLLALISVAMADPTGSTGGSTSLPGLGQINLSAESSEIQPSAIVYKSAHMTAQNGATLDADEIRANLVEGGKLDNAVATGHVRAHISSTEQKGVYTITADKGVFSPKGNRIDLTGNVRAVVESPMTTGPMVQTGDTGVVYLGKAPVYPKLVMTNVHATLTPAQ
jgi:lipopolysaccharide export system protein LptA